MAEYRAINTVMPHAGLRINSTKSMIGEPPHATPRHAAIKRMPDALPAHCHACCHAAA